MTVSIPPTRILGVIALLYCGTLALLGIETFLEAPVLESLVHWLGLGALGAGSASLLGAGVWRSSTMWRASAAHWGLGFVAGVLSFLGGLVYVSLLIMAFGSEEAEGDLFVPSPWEKFETVVLAPLLEEWVCRGVLWSASRRMLNSGGTLVLTSVLFALLHGLGGGYLAELPHRFVSGLLFGWLRAKTTSLGPSVCAHGVNNLAATLLV